MADFVKLCKTIVDKAGYVCCQDVLDCGYTMEQALRIVSDKVSTDRLVKNANEALRARGICYKKEATI